MITQPLNDEACLGSITDRIAALVAQHDPVLLTLAERHPTTGELVRWMRGLPQRDDLGTPADRPKVAACDPPQRLRIAPADPNCVERAALYLGVAELLDPEPARQLATVDTPAGRHTLPVEDGEPVVLDPKHRRNALRAGLFQLGRQRNGGARVALTPTQAVDWIASLAAEPSRRFRDGEQRARNGHRALRGVLAGHSLCGHELRDVVFVLALADREARAYGRPGRCIVGATVRAVDHLDSQATRSEMSARRNGVGLRIGPYTMRPDGQVWRALARVGGRLGYQAGVVALREKLATLGMTAPLLSTFERELNREGLSLGALAAPPPMTGTLDAVTPQALAGRWLATKL